MFINAKTVIITIIIVIIGLYIGLHFVRQFALQIAQENHDAIVIMDQAENEKRIKQERIADQAVETAYAKVQPILTTMKIPNNNNTNTVTTSNNDQNSTTTKLITPPPPAPSSGAIMT